MAGGQSGGYRFTLTATPTGYAITAIPLRYRTDGRNSYFSDQTMEIHHHNGQEAASVNDPLLRDSSERDSSAVSNTAALLGGGLAVAWRWLGGGLAITLCIASFVGGLVGWLLVMKKVVLQCSVCSAVVNAS